ncbi:MAG: YggW family oxidoreductase [Gammaproteobacteria bacterium RIFCSPLOWO2_02_FULL_42_14]|nr:MAG: YggW family oxidoreductase [Gammaproteobacteria bacterium RIFCSPHIGHO2_02_FULL_42_43]OGT52292.1 MAG: YggW family oxidoreductase [Gammaproteobacteria bacterium RIFCSPHIGHO2_12_FULL_41_25]OGT61904.1 MAG: YggW family oxidoreductase [Gammaproteobacteria bacterium RIFCSPLOWO2_02_FULL_42_14]OGT86385.1 MAG: YggW family oxidoreductase [Gammaproteobacteria bacterium RIFCSPLOWO2_12_FULL_42_18]
MTIPLSLYIHIPWCIKKCPYCDFNSHTKQGDLPEIAYVSRLIADLQTQLPYVQERPITSVFIGGGTPSLFSPTAYDNLFSQLRKYLSFEKNAEITLEANPGAIDHANFDGYLQAGINRLSIGVQSFQNEKLKTLGRIHQSEDAKKSVIAAKKAGFDNINIDLMFGLPDQSQQDALHDLEMALQQSPTHLSWYQLTLEPNTFFHRFPPTLPADDFIFEIQLAGQSYLSKNYFHQYEISAYAKNNQRCKHNLNYWEFGDYLGIGAGAHAKYTDLKTGKIFRRANTKHPKMYLSDLQYEIKHIPNSELALEFMLNALRLHQPISNQLLFERTGLRFFNIQSSLNNARDKKFLFFDNHSITLTDQGRLFLNEVLMCF